MTDIPAIDTIGDEGVQAQLNTMIAGMQDAQAAQAIITHETMIHKTIMKAMEAVQSAFKDIKA